MKRALFALIAVLGLPTLLLAADSVGELGFDEEALKNAFFSNLRGWPSAPSVPSALRTLPTEQKVAAIRTLGAFAKAYVGSPDFKKDYSKAYKESKPRSGFGLPRIDLKAIADKAVDKAVDKATGTRAEDRTLDKDPNVQLKKRLQAFLDETSDVDFQARTTGTGYARRFADEENEARSNTWKMCFRAGPDVTGAARAFAEEWLAELP